MFTIQVYQTISFIRKYVMFTKHEDYRYGRNNQSYKYMRTKLKSEVTYFLFLVVNLAGELMIINLHTVFTSK